MLIQWLLALIHIIIILCYYILLIANIDYEKTAVTLTFLPSDEPQVVCDAVRIIDDAIGNEPEEEFSVTLISASPEGSFGDNESCITIIDDDSKCMMYLPLSFPYP